MSGRGQTPESYFFRANYTAGFVCITPFQPPVSTSLLIDIESEISRVAGFTRDGFLRAC